MFNVFKHVSFSIAVLSIAVATAGAPAKRSTEKQKAEITGHGPAVLWRHPKDIATRDLIYGPGGKAHSPVGPFTFDKEDLKGTNPKFDVIAANGGKWKVKLGEEAQPETVASRLVWAVGYFANEDYFVPVLRVKDMPTLKRGRKLVTPDGVAYGARMKRSVPGQKKIGEWEWLDDRFTNTREWNGLRTLMAVINNWDLKDENNAIYQAEGPQGPEQLYMVSDLGSSFGTTGLSWTKRGSKGNLKAYRHSKWIKNIGPEYVDFNVPSRPALDHFPDIPALMRRLRLRKIGWNVPRKDARWMGNLLGELSAKQIRDAFRSAGYEAGTVEAYSRVVESRIAELKRI
jgi:hypothetical protein